MILRIAVLLIEASQISVLPHAVEDLRSCFHHLWCVFVSFAAGNTNEFLNAAGVTKGLGVLHVLGDDFMQSAADRCNGVIGHALAGAGAGAVVIVAPW